MYEKERQTLVDKLSENGINDIYVLKAISDIERHLFVSEAMLIHSYKDIALPIGYGQTISQPYTVAFMTQALKVKPDAKILEIGTGPGYEAALLHRMGAKMFSIERQFEIYDRTQKLFDNLQIRFTLSMAMELSAGKNIHLMMELLLQQDLQKYQSLY